MQLDSARELKAVLSTKVIASLGATVAARGLSISAQPFRQSGGVHATIALGIARKGRNNFRIAVRLQRREMADSPHLELIRKRAKGEVDERYIGRVAKQAKQTKPWHQQGNRPLLIGGSIGHFNITAGTLGCFVASKADDSVLILSNNHVLADENQGKIGDAILQPGKYDGGVKAQDTIGGLVDFIKMKVVGANTIDAAVCSVKNSIKYDHKALTDLGTLAGLGDAFLDEGTAVHKVGRTTGLTHGRVTAFELDNVVVGYDIGDLRFDDQIEIEGAEAGPFSQGGDSGSLIVNDEYRGVGLLFAGGDQGGSNGKGLTYANPLGRVLDALKVKLLYL